MDNIFIRLAVVCLLAFLGFEAFKELRRPDKDEYMEQLQKSKVDSGELAPGDNISDADIPKEAKIKNPVKLLTLFVILAAGVGFVAVRWVIPMLGDAVSGATFSSGEQQEASIYSKGHSLVTQGRYEEALAEFGRLAEEHPADRTPVMEMVKLQLGRLENPDGAIATLEHALQREWPEDEATFFLLRLATIQAEEKFDNAAAKDILNQIINQYPGTPAAANSTHKLREIEEAEFLASRGGQ